MSDISFCIITKNNEATLKNCLDSIKDLVQEMILVDTGSTDNTKNIAQDFKAKVYDFKWTDNFSEAKNFALSKASKKWILFLDADETISKRDFNKIIELTKKEEYEGFAFIQRNYTNNIGEPSLVSCKEDPYEESHIASGYSPRKIIRLFKNKPEIKFEGVVHDSVENSISKIGKYGETDIPIHHFGILNRTKDRTEFYIELEKKNYKGGFFQDYQIGSQLNGLNKLEEAEEYLKKSVKNNPSFFASWFELGLVFLKKGKFKEAKENFEKAEEIKPDANCENYLGVLLGKIGDLTNSAIFIKKAISKIPKNADFHFNLGLTYHQMNLKKEAFFEFKKAIELNPKYKEMIQFE